MLAVPSAARVRSAAECPRELRQQPGLAMLLDFDIASASRQCAVSGRTFAPGETYFSLLQFNEGAAERRDVSSEAWQGPPEGAFAWWKSQAPHADAARPKLAPQDVLLNLFAELAEKPQELEFRYVLALLLIRRKLLKLEDARRDDGHEMMLLDCPKLGQQFELPVPVLAPDRIEQLQSRMIDLLYGGA
jgi:hypothetical protein